MSDEMFSVDEVEEILERDRSTRDPWRESLDAQLGSACERMKSRLGGVIAKQSRVVYSDAESSVARRYGISPEQEMLLIAARGWLCWCCDSSLEGLDRGEWVIDHCHETGAVRGILCRRCNVTLGYLGDSPGSLKARAMELAAYLEAGPYAAKAFIEIGALAFPQREPRRWTGRLARVLWSETGLGLSLVCQARAARS